MQVKIYKTDWIWCQEISSKLLIRKTSLQYKTLFLMCKVNELGKRVNNKTGFDVSTAHINNTAVKTCHSDSADSGSQNGPQQFTIAVPSCHEMRAHVNVRFTLYTRDLSSATCILVHHNIH